MCGNKDHKRRPPPLSRLWTGTVRVQSTVAEMDNAFGKIKEGILTKWFSDLEREEYASIDGLLEVRIRSIQNLLFDRSYSNCTRPLARRAFQFPMVGVRNSKDLSRLFFLRRLQFITNCRHLLACRLLFFGFRKELFYRFRKRALCALSFGIRRHFRFIILLFWFGQCIQEVS